MNKQLPSQIHQNKRPKPSELTLEKRTIRTLSGSELQLIAGGDRCDWTCVCTCHCNHTQVITVAPPK